MASLWDPLQGVQDSVGSGRSSPCMAGASHPLSRHVGGRGKSGPQNSEKAGQGRACRGLFLVSVTVIFNSENGFLNEACPGVKAKKKSPSSGPNTPGRVRGWHGLVLLGGAVDSGPSAARAAVHGESEAAAEGHSAPWKRSHGDPAQKPASSRPATAHSGPTPGTWDRPGTGLSPLLGLCFLPGCLLHARGHTRRGSEQGWLERGLFCYRPAMLRAALRTALWEGTQPRDPQPIRNQDDSRGSFR